MNAFLTSALILHNLKRIFEKVKKEKIINPLDLIDVYIENVKIHNFIYLNVSM